MIQIFFIVRRQPIFPLQRSHTFCQILESSQLSLKFSLTVLFNSPLVSQRLENELLFFLTFTLVFSFSMLSRAKILFKSRKDNRIKKWKDILPTTTNSISVSSAGDTFRWTSGGPLTKTDYLPTASTVYHHENRLMNFSFLDFWAGSETYTLAGSWRVLVRVLKS